MSGSKKYSVFSLVISLLMLLASLAFLIYVNVEISSIESNGGDFSGLAIAVLMIFAIPVAFYGAISLLASILKLLGTCLDAWGFAVPALLLDLALTAVGGYFTYSVLTNSAETAELLISALLILIPAAALLSDCIWIAKRDE